jgi:hypothetical protein
MHSSILFRADETCQNISQYHSIHYLGAVELIERCRLPPFSQIATSLGVSPTALVQKSQSDRRLPCSLIDSKPSGLDSSKQDAGKLVDGSRGSGRIIRLGSASFLSHLYPGRLQSRGSRCHSQACKHS